MITGLDLDTIGPPPRYPFGSRPRRVDASLESGDGPVAESGAVSIAAAITVRGPCSPPLFDDLGARISALLGEGVREVLFGGAPAGVGPALHSVTLAHAFSIYRCLRHGPRGSEPARGHPSQAAAGPGSP